MVTYFEVHLKYLENMNIFVVQKINNILVYIIQKIALLIT